MFVANAAASNPAAAMILPVIIVIRIPVFCIIKLAKGADRNGNSEIL